MSKLLEKLINVRLNRDDRWPSGHTVWFSMVGAMKRSQETNYESE